MHVQLVVQQLSFPETATEYSYQVTHLKMQNNVLLTPSTGNSKEQSHVLKSSFSTCSVLKTCADNVSCVKTRPCVSNVTTVFDSFYNGLQGKLATNTNIHAPSSLFLQSYILAQHGYMSNRSSLV